MALLELYAAPRITTASRFKTSMSYMHIVRTLQRAFVRYDADVQDRVAEGEDLDDAPMQEMLQELSSSAHRQCRCQ